MRKSLSLLVVLLVSASVSAFAQDIIRGTSQGLPITTILVKQQYLNQMGSIGNTTLFTVKYEADIRISTYITSSSCTINGTAINVEFAWTDSSSQFSAGIGGLGCTSQGGAYYGWASQIIHAKAGTPITMHTSGDPNTPYSLYVTLERI